MNEGRNSVYQILSSAQENKILIPSYQRPYVWGQDEIEELLENIKEAYEESVQDKNSNKKLFLGNIIFCLKKKENENDMIELIDGQQRLTTLTLILLSLYKKIEPINPVYSKIRSTLWKTGYEGENIIAYNDQPNIISQFAANGISFIPKFDSFNNLMTNVGNYDDDSLYCKNFTFITRKFEEFNQTWEQQTPRLFYPSSFADFLLEKIKLHVIKSDSQDEALETFRVLNDKGIPLYDSDFLKAYLMEYIISKNKNINEFSDTWNNITELANEYIQIKATDRDAKSPIDRLFYVYMEYLNAIDGTKERYTNIRKFFLQRNAVKLKSYNDEEVMPNLQSALNFFMYSMERDYEVYPSQTWSQNKEIRKIFDILRYIPISRIWDSPWIYYSKWYNSLRDQKKENEFEDNYLNFLKKYLAIMLVSYINKPNDSCVKDQKPAMNVAIVRSSNVNYKQESVGFKFINYDRENLRNLISAASKKNKDKRDSFMKPILAFLAYYGGRGQYIQEELLPKDWQIEHIYPQSRRDRIDEVERLGNKLPLTGIENKQASDNYFDEKCKIYNQSAIAMVKYIPEQYKDHDAWQNLNRVGATIQDREGEMVSQLSDILKKMFEE